MWLHGRRYATKPAYYVLDEACIVDQHGEVCGNPEGDVLEYLAKAKNPQVIGPLNQGWIQCQYNWHYGVEEGGQRYWMYEEVTLNAVCTKEFDADYFLRTEPRIIFKDQ